MLIVLLMAAGCKTMTRNQPQWSGDHALVVTTDSKVAKETGELAVMSASNDQERVVGPLRKVGYEQDLDRSEASVAETNFATQAAKSESRAAGVIPSDDQGPGQPMIDNVATGLPIDFPTVLRLAGADNWNVKLARERVCEAAANYNLARVAWLPTVNLGIGYNHHEGEIQATDGSVIQASRGSLFAGGGGRISSNPIAGADNGPARLQADFSLADAVFQPLAARQTLEAAKAQRTRVFNDVMLDAATAYYDLVRAQAQVAIAIENEREANTLFRIINEFVKAEMGTPADTNRIKVIVNQQKQALAQARAQVGVASARLANLLQLDSSKLDPAQGLYALEGDVMPMHLIPLESELEQLTQQALATRQEITAAERIAQARHAQYRAEQVRPLFPNLNVGVSSGFFGGGTGGSLPKMDARSDVDIQMLWELRNLGAGNKAARELRRSQMNQAIYGGRQIKDQVAVEVAMAFHDVQLQHATIGLTQDSILQSENSLRLIIEAIRALDGAPLDSVQALQDTASARLDYLDAVVDYNQAQLRLMRAIGEPIESSQ